MNKYYHYNFINSSGIITGGGLTTVRFYRSVRHAFILALKEAPEELAIIDFKRVK